MQPLLATKNMRHQKDAILVVLNVQHGVARRDLRLIPEHETLRRIRRSTDAFQRKFQPEGAALARRAVYADAPAHQLHHAARECQAHPGSQFGAALAPEPVERLIQMRLLLWREPRPVRSEEHT